LAQKPIAGFIDPMPAARLKQRRSEQLSKNATNWSRQPGIS